MFAPPIPLAPPSVGLTPGGGSSSIEQLQLPELPKLTSPIPDFLNPLNAIPKIFDAIFGTPAAEAPTLPKNRTGGGITPPVATPTSLAKPPFTGGQDRNVLYNVFTKVLQKNTGSVTENRVVESFFQGFGSISNVKVVNLIPLNNDSSSKQVQWFGVRGDGSKHYLGGGTGTIPSPNEVDAELLEFRVERSDGKPDTGGNPPPTGDKANERGNNLTPPPAYGFGATTAPPPTKPRIPDTAPPGKPPLTPRPDEKPGERIKPFPRKNPKPKEENKPKSPPLNPPKAPPETPTLPPVSPPKAPPETPTKPKDKPGTKPNDPVIPPLPDTPTKPTERPEIPKPNADPKEKEKVVPNSPPRREETDQERIDRQRREEQDRQRREEETTLERIRRETQEREQQQRRRDEEKRRVGAPPGLPEFPATNENNNINNQNQTAPSTETGGANQGGGSRNNGGFNPGVITPPPVPPGTGKPPGGGTPGGGTPGGGTPGGGTPGGGTPGGGGMNCQQLRDCLSSDPNNVETVSIKKFSRCNPDTGMAEFENVQITVNKGDKAFVQSIAESLANIEAEQCKECNAVALIPEWWQTRTGQRPQLVVRYQNVNNDGTIGTSAWSLAIPHYIKDKNYKPAFPKYKRGDYQGILVLGDNSKCIVNCATTTEAKRVIAAIKQFINPEFIKGSYEKYGERKGTSFAEINVKPISAKFFPDGQKNNTAEWSIRLS